MVDKTAENMADLKVGLKEEMTAAMKGKRRVVMKVGWKEERMVA